MRWLSFALAVALPTIASAQVVTGAPAVLDGDTLEMGELRIRLYGIDAPEAAQTCSRNGVEWACGQDAKAMLAALIDGKQVNCEQKDRDKYGRMVAICKTERTDLGEALVEGGMAIALPDFTDAYLPSEALAQSRRRGIWASEFQTPAEFRASDPGTQQELERLSKVRQVQQAVGARPTVYYRNCTEARAAGAAPIYRGQPGYRPEMDGDNDGIACEPYRGHS